MGRTRAAAMASPMARRRASRGRRDAVLRRVLAGARERMSTVQGWRGPPGTRAIDGTHVLAAGGRRRIEDAREPTHTVLLSDHYCVSDPVDAHRLHARACRCSHWATGATRRPRCATAPITHVHVRRVLCELREAVLGER